MMNFRYSVYGRIRVRLTGVLHIGGEPEDDAVTEKDAAALARDGEGRYIIPASGLAGVVRHFLEERESETGEQQNDVDRMLAFFGGSEAGENRIYFYDGICENVMLERRAGSRMDHAMGTAQEGGLHAKVCLAPGMTTVLPLQIFAEDEEKRETAVKLIQEIAGALDSGRIKLGAGTANGAGTFRVQKISYRSLDLQDRHDLDRYLEGLDDLLTGQGEGWKELTWEKVPEPDQFILTVDAPEGILVKNYSQTDIADAVNVSFCIADDADTLHYYIPGTSFKGVLRTGAEKIWSTLHLPAEDLEQIFGSAPDSQNNRQKSHIYVRDTDLWGYRQQKRMPAPTNISREIEEAAFAIFQRLYRWEKPIRSIGISVGDLKQEGQPRQLSLFLNEQYRERQMRADRMVTMIRSRYGYAAVQRGIMHEDRYLSSLNATAEDHMIHPHSYLEHGNRSGCETVLCAENS